VLQPNNIVTVRTSVRVGLKIKIDTIFAANVASDVLWFSDLLKTENC